MLTEMNVAVQGLDSLGAMNIVHLLRRLADAGQAIICTIHQASQEQFELVSGLTVHLRLAETAD